MKGLHNTLYKRDETVLRYHARWPEHGLLLECWGVVGELGELRERQMPDGASTERAIAEARQSLHARGFATVDMNAYVRLLVEHEVGRTCNAEDADERITLEYRIGALLDQTGLGGTSGGEMWPTSYEVFCFVVDFEIAKRVISADLLSTKYTHARIYEEDPAIFGPVPSTFPTLKR